MTSLHEVSVWVTRHWYFDWSCILRVYGPRAASPVRASYKSDNLYRDLRPVPKGLAEAVFYLRDCEPISNLWAKRNVVILKYRITDDVV